MSLETDYKETKCLFVKVWEKETGFNFMKKIKKPIYVEMVVFVLDVFYIWININYELNAKRDACLVMKCHIVFKMSYLFFSGIRKEYPKNPKQTTT